MKPTPKSETSRNRPSSSAESDRQLVDALLGGDRLAGEELVAGTYQPTFRALLKLSGDTDLAADLTQESFRRAWSSLHTFRGDSTFSSWLYRIAYTTFLNHVRRPRPIQPLGNADFASQREHPEDRSTRGDVERRVRIAVIELPDAQRLAVTAKFWGGLSTAEIADLEKVSDVAIRKRVRKAITRLAKALPADPRSTNTATAPNQSSETGTCS